MTETNISQFDLEFDAGLRLETRLFQKLALFSANRIGRLFIPLPGK